MTVIYHSVQYLLPIALVTITLGAHIVKGDASEGESTNTGGCISDWRGMKNAYLQHQSSADVENSIFDFYPGDVLSYGVLVMFYDVGPPPNTSTSGRRECCQRGSKDCIIHFIYRFTVFKDIHPRLLYSRAGHRFKTSSAYDTSQLCWAPPPLCSNRSEKMLHEFSTQFVSLVAEESSIPVETPAYVYAVSFVHYSRSLHLITAITIFLFATVGLLLILFMHHSWGVVGTVLAQSQVARHTMRSTMLTLWGLFLWGMVHFYMRSKEMVNAVQEMRLLKIFQDVYSPQVTAGYVQLGSFLAILLLEAPFFCVFLLRKATDLHNRRQQLFKTDCRLCYWFRVLCDTLGGIGVVAAVQTASVYLFYSTLYLIVLPTLVLVWVSTFVANIVSFVVCLTIVLHMFSSCCKTCSLGRIIKGLTFILLGLLYIAINYYLIEQVKRDKQAGYDTIHGLLRSLVSSVIISLYGYTVKRLLFSKKEVEGEESRENQEMEPLMQEEENIA